MLLLTHQFNPYFPHFCLQISFLFLSIVCHLLPSSTFFTVTRNVSSLLLLSSFRLSLSFLPSLSLFIGLKLFTTVNTSRHSDNTAYTSGSLIFAFWWFTIYLVSRILLQFFNLFFFSILCLSYVSQQIFCNNFLHIKLGWRISTFNADTFSK